MLLAFCKLSALQVIATMITPTVFENGNGFAHATAKATVTFAD